MIVKELIEKLQKLDQELELIIFDHIEGNDFPLTEIEIMPNINPQAKKLNAVYLK